jgi:hypothetical protein
MHIRAADGTDVRSDVLLDCLPPTPQKGTISQFIKLGPKTFHGRVDDFKLSDFVKKPGQYDIEVTFKSFISSDWILQNFSDDPIFKLPLWTDDQDALVAPRVHITVKAL